MPNYYEMLQVETTATPEEIVQAIDKRYNDTRKLVTHHDPNVVNQANQALQLLETIRSTLVDSDKRHVYDQAVGLTGITGGLLDPSQFLSQMPGMQVAAKAPAVQAQPVPQVVVAAQAPGIWSCSKCKTDNPPQAVHCFKCGAQLVRDCPECHRNTSLISTGICGQCGYSFDVATERRKLERLLSQKKLEVYHAQRDLISTSTQGSASALLMVFGILTILVGGSCLLMSLPGFIDSELIPYTIVGILISLVIMAIGVGGIVLYVVLNRKANMERVGRVSAKKEVLDRIVRDVQPMEQRYRTLGLNKTEL